MGWCEIIKRGQYSDLIQLLHVIYVGASGDYKAVTRLLEKLKREC